MTFQRVVAFAPNAASLLQFLCKHCGPIIYEITLESGKRIQFQRDRPFDTIEEGRQYLRQQFGWTWNAKHYAMSSAQEEEMQRYFDEQTNKK